MGEDWQYKAREFAKAYGLLPNRHWAYKQRQLPSEDVALNAPLALDKGYVLDRQ